MEIVRMYGPLVGRVLLALIFIIAGRRMRDKYRSEIVVTEVVKRLG